MGPRGDLEIGLLLLGLCRAEPALCSWVRPSGHGEGRSCLIIFDPSVPGWPSGVLTRSGRGSPTGLQTR